MTELQRILDILMCACWISTYTVCFVSTIKYKYPALSPVTQLIIAPFEFAALYRFISDGTFGFDYVSIAYLYWSSIEFGLLFLIIKYRFHFEKKKSITYILLCAVMTILMIYIVAYKGHVFFCSYFNTFVGELFWFIYIRDENYPMKTLNLTAFIIKLIGDAMAVYIYISMGNTIIKIICALLPILDLCFIVVFFKRVYETRVLKVKTRKKTKLFL